MKELDGSDSVGYKELVSALIDRKWREGWVASVRKVFLWK